MYNVFRASFLAALQNASEEAIKEVYLEKTKKAPKEANYIWWRGVGYKAGVSLARKADVKRRRMIAEKIIRDEIKTEEREENRVINEFLYFRELLVSGGHLTPIETSMLTAIELRMMGTPHQQIADHLGITRVNLAKRYQRGRQMLRGVGMSEFSLDTIKWWCRVDKEYREPRRLVHVYAARLK